VAKIALWAHNSHLGDARATYMGQLGELNIGQMMRERFGEAAVLVGFTTAMGTVTAASDWDAPMELKRVRPAMAGSYENIFHETAVPRFFLDLREHSARRALADPLLERAIGVIYRPETERQSHYFQASLSSQFDAVVHFDQTKALRPLETTAHWDHHEVPETYPTGV
jgi:erythromycin esterase-like protein